MLKNTHSALLVLMSAALLSGCATITPVSGHFPNISPQQAQSGVYKGKTVRWGGKLIETQPKTQDTCFTVLGEPLHQDGRPKSERGEAHIGRFLACAAGFYDPMLYREGREITFVGRVEGITHRKIGQFNYAYPKLSASTVYLWPIEPQRPHVQEQVYLSTGFGYYPGWWYGPGWGFGPGWW